jgi:hypothetical protein
MNKLAKGPCAFYNTVNRYNLLECGPQPKQPLHLLYPGRYMEPYFNPSGSNIPNEDMEGLDKSRKMSRSLRVAYDMEMEALSRHLGGKDKIYPFPAAAPESVVQDPRLATISMADSLPEIMRGNDPSRGFGATYSEYNNLDKINSLDVDMVNKARREDNISQRNTNLLDDDGRLPEYDWGKQERDTYPFVEDSEPTYNEDGTLYSSSYEGEPINKSIENYDGSVTSENDYEYSNDGSSSSSSSSIFSVNWILLIVFIILFVVVIVFCVIYFG